MYDEGEINRSGEKKNMVYFVLLKKQIINKI